MSDRLKLVVGLGVLVVGLGVLVALVWLRSGADDLEAERASETTPAQPPRELPGSGRSSAPGSESSRSIAKAPVTPAGSAARDATGEPLSAGPAQPVSLPERPEGALDNTPSPEQSEAARTRVLDRLDAEIAAAKAAGDTDAVARLEVRRARLERKSDEAETPSP